VRGREDKKIKNKKEEEEMKKKKESTYTLQIIIVLLMCFSNYVNVLIKSTKKTKIS